MKVTVLHTPITVLHTPITVLHTPDTPSNPRQARVSKTLIRFNNI